VPGAGTDYTAGTEEQPETRNTNCQSIGPKTAVHVSTQTIDDSLEVLAQNFAVKSSDEPVLWVKKGLHGR
jgi:hypothetical protein